MGTQHDNDSDDAGKRWGFSRRGFLKTAAVGSGAAANLSALSGLAGATSALIADENSQIGAQPSEWEVEPDDSIEGFSTQFSVNAGETIRFKIRTASTAYRINIYRLGWYAGRGARKVVSFNPSVPLPQSQPDPVVDPTTGLIECSNWAESASWTVPADAVSGVYVANLIRQDAPGENRILFVVRNDGRPSDLLLQTSETTWQAYNRWGGNSLYSGSASYGRATKVSYDRPLGNHGLENEFWYAEYPLLRWLERNGYDVAYFADIDSHQRPAELLLHRAFVSSGHDEYWSGRQRENVEAARDAGVNLVFMTGNEVFWKVRWESALDGTPERTMVCYKETLQNAKIDPSPEWTGTWRDARFSPPSNGGRPENALTGTLFRAINPNYDPDFSIKVPHAYAALRIWRDTSVADLEPGETATFPQGTLGYEWDTDEDNGHRPAGLIRMSETTETADQVLVDEGGNYVRKPLTHYLTMYRAASGALVWGTGTVQWSWGLDSTHDNSPGIPVPTDVRMQQATVNVLADMQVQPGTLQSGLVRASASSDTIPPVTTITSPSSDTTVPIGSPVTVTGTATDSGGVVAAVEVSTDGGDTWAPAVGTSGWSYTFTPMTMGPLEILARAIDDSLNLEIATAAVKLTAGMRSLPASLWNDGTIPALTAADDASPLELGLKFRTTMDGFITGVRFYKGETNTGTHTGTLWTAAGSALATVTFDDESATGWQQALFTTPVAVSADTTYVVSYHAPNGGYPADAGYFGEAFELVPLRALATGEDGPNGVYRSGSSGFPTSTWGATNYWVDVVFDVDDGRAPTVVDRTPAEGLESVSTATTVAAQFSEGMDADSITMSLTGPAAAEIDATVTYDAPTRTAVLEPNEPLSPYSTYTATVSTARDLSGTSISGPVSWSFTTVGGPGAPSVSLWDTSAIPAIASLNDPNAVEIGVKFTADKDGSVSAARFYKGPQNNGTQLGRLWAADGTLLATTTFSGGSATGWQQADFGEPVDISKNTTYVMSVLMPNGGYSADSGGLASAVDTVPLHALASGSTGGNGVYRYGGGFPTSSFNDTNYWVDLVFRPAPDVSPPVVVDRTPAPDVQAVATNTAVTAVFNESVLSDSLEMALTGPGGSAVPATVTYDASTATAVLAPSAALSANTTYSASVSATDGAGNAMAPLSWSFTTATPVGQTPATIWDSSAAPAVAAAGDTNAVELGVKFTSQVAGAITGIRFFKGAGNNGPHVGRLWTATGTLLGQVNFDSETASGWQQANFASPIPIQASTVYVASYHAPSGRYSHTGNGLSSSTERAPLRALAGGGNGGNGVYQYGPSGFPTNSFGNSNYWVDVVFADTAGPNVASTTPASGAVDVASTSTVSAAFDEPVQSGLVMEVRDQTGTLVDGAVAYDSATRTATWTPASNFQGSRTYTATVSGARDAGGNPMAVPVSWSFTIAADPVVLPGISLFPAGLQPATQSANDSSAVELGMKFRATEPGRVTGIRFYKGTGNNGPHVGRLYSANGAVVAEVTFVDEAETGWQTALLTAPVTLEPDTNYVVTYHAPVGRYAVTGAFFNPGDYVNGPLIGRGNYSSDRNGVYQYGAGGTMPTSSFGGSNYFVDVVFEVG